MGSLVWSTTGASSRGSSREGWLGPRSPSMHPYSPRGFSGPFQGALGNPPPLAPALQVLSCGATTHTTGPLPTPPPEQSALSASACQPAFLFRVLPLWSQSAPSLVGTWACNYRGPLSLPLGPPVSLDSEDLLEAWAPSTGPGETSPPTGDPNREACLHPRRNLLLMLLGPRVSLWPLWAQACWRQSLRKS